MALRQLTIEEMVQISAPWATSGTPARSALQRVAHLAALLAQIDEAHRGIHAAKPTTEDATLKQLSAEEAALDVQHDTLVRGTHGVLTMLAEVSAAADELLGLRDLLFPEGLEHIRKTYRGEAGHAAMVASRLNKSARARLKAVTLHDKTLLDLADEWLAIAKKLGELEAERAHLSEASPGTPGQVNAARLQWIRVVNAMIAMAELAEIDADTDALLFAALRAAERAASGRARRRAPVGEPAPEPTPSPEPLPSPNGPAGGSQT